MKTILITGSCGFIGSNFIRKVNYNKLPYKLVCVDKITHNQFMNNIYYNKANQFYLADICDQHIIDRIFELETPDFVLHLAAESSVDLSIKNPSTFALTNVVGTQNMLNASVKHKVKKFVFASSDEVYGSLKTDEDSWTELSPINPKNPYSASKACGELLIKSIFNQFGLPFIITRCSNNYGARQSNNKLIPTIVKCILEDKKIPIYGDGSMSREWLYVSDNVSALIKLLECGEDNSIYNIGSGAELSNLELTQKICNIFGKGQELISFVDDPRGNNHDKRYSVNCNKLKSLDWNTKTKFVDGLEKTVDWYRNNSFFLR